MSEVGRPRNATKADVRVEARGGRAVVVKDFSGRSLPVRLLVGRPALAREERVYRRLAGLAGIPACLGREGPDRLVLELAPGTPLDRLRPGEVPPAVFDDLDRLLGEIHERGVAVADLHRSNVLVDGERVHVIDFAIARIARRPGSPGWLVRHLQALDRHAAARLRARYLGLPEPRPEGAFGLLYRLGRGVKALLRRIRGRR